MSLPSLHFHAPGACRRLILISAALLAVAPLLPAQAVDDDDADTASDEITTLPEFSVTANTNSEYMAAESTTGTRVASKIKDLPFTVNVVTSEFMNDFDAQEFGEQFAYTSNVVAYETISTGYSVRGFAADVQLRNGFRRIGLIDKVDVDRAEVIKGPAASIYGATLPGGIVNIVTKKPKSKPEYQLGLAAGSNSFLRASVSATGPVGASRTFFYRVDMAADKRNYDLPYKDKRQATGSAQLQWKPNRNTSFLFEAERLVRTEHGNANVPFTVETGVTDPYYVDATTGVSQNRTYTRYTGVATELSDFNVQGPQNHSNRYVNTLTGTFEHRFNDVFSFRSSANWFDRDLERQEVAGRGEYNPDLGRVSSATSASGASSYSWVPRLRPYGEGGAGWQNDLLSRFETGPVKHKLLVTLDWQLQTEQPKRYDGLYDKTTVTSPAFPDDSTVLHDGLDPMNPDYRYLTFAEKPEAYSQSQNEDNSLNIYGVFVSDRLTFLDGRLIALLGGRYDYAVNHAQKLPLYNNSSSDSYVTDKTTHTDQLTYQTGLNFKIVEPLTLYANASTSFVPQLGTGIDPLTYETFDLPNETGQGWEAGVKAALFKNNLTFTLGYFDITRSNVAHDAVDPDNGTTITYISGEEAAKGVEFDFNWVVNRELQFFGGYGYTDSQTVSNSTAPHLIGTPTRRTPANTLGLGMKYSIKSGSFKGLYFTAGYKYNSESLINPSTGRKISTSGSRAIINSRLPNGQLVFPDLPENMVVTDVVVDGKTKHISARVDDGRESIYNDPFSVADVGMGYSWRGANRRYRHKVQLNVKNLFDQIYTYGSAGQGPRRSYTLTYYLSF